MKLRDAVICVDCEEVYDIVREEGCCPACTCSASVFICRWVPTVAEVSSGKATVQELRAAFRTVIKRGGDVDASTALAPVWAA